MNKKEYLSLFKKYHIEENYAEFIDEDNNLLVNYHYDINFSNLNLNAIPIKFNYIFGSFYCKNNQLKDLNNCPAYVENTFDCSNNQIKKLIGGPQKVGDYMCENNQLENFLGIADVIDGHLFCFGNQFKSLQYFPSMVTGACWMFIEEDLEYLQALNLNGNLIDIANENSFSFWKNISEDEQRIHDYKNIELSIKIDIKKSNQKIKI